MKPIPLTRGKVAWVDDADYERIVEHKWMYQKCKKQHTGYAARWKHISKGVRRLVFMHREILGLDGGRYPMVDHRNRDGLLNIRENLRVCSPSQNAANRIVSSTSQTGVKGVSFVRSTGRYWAHLWKNGKHINLGCFATIEEAAKAYSNGANIHHGEFARMSERPLVKLN